MIRIIVTGHGMFAAGMKAAMEMLSGQHEELAFVNFDQTLSTDELRDKLLKSLGSRETGGTLILCDLTGGTPFHTAAGLSACEEQVEVIGGMNLGMLMEAVFSRDTCTNVSELAAKCIQSLKESVQHFTFGESDDRIDSDEL